MLITPDNSTAFYYDGMTRHIKRLEDKDDDRAYIARVKDSFEKLIEFKSNICSLDIMSSRYEVILTAGKGIYYDVFHDAMKKNLTWETEINGVDYEQSAKRWLKLMGNHSGIRKTQLDEIKSNDLDRPDLAFFKEAITMFFVMSKEFSKGTNDRTASYYASDEWIELYVTGAPA